MTRPLVIRSALAAVLALGVIGAAAPAGSASGTSLNRSAKPLTLAVIGDVPYGAEQEAAFSDLINAVDADPLVRDVIHVGDIKSGSTTCSDERFAAVAEAFATFQDPLVYTPGDNEWTDCHRVNNGAYDPLERLTAIRKLFFADPGQALGGRPKTLDHQPELVENVRWVESRVAFATVHLIGSNNGLAPWTGLGLTAPSAAQASEVAARVAADVSWVDETFDIAEDAELPGVILAMQADTWDPAPGSAQQAVVDRIAERTAAFDGEVLLIQGDSHVYTADNPLDLPNFTRVVVHGETLPFEYLRLKVDPVHGSLFSWTRVPVKPTG